jgi:creatinine amidohydrolase
MIKLAELTYVEARRVGKDPRAVVMLPLGAIEQHGPHLPLCVDLVGAEEIARRMAPHLERAGWRVVLAPSLPYGVSSLAIAWAGTVSLSVATASRLIVEVVRALARHGFRRVVLTNYQADPEHLRAIARAQRALARARVRVLIAGFAPPARRPNPMLDARVRRVMRSPRPEREWHSGELETALMLAVAPRLVRRRVARRLPPAWTDWAQALGRGARTFQAMQPGGRGYFGWPATARAATGRRAMALRGRLLAAAVLEALGPRPRRATAR